MQEILKVGDHKMGVPYSPVDRGVSVNHGFFDLRKTPELIPRIPEAEGWPEMIALLEAINRPSGILWSLGCEKAVSSFKDERHPHLTTKLVSYVDLAFADVSMNSDRANFDRMAMALNKFGSTRQVETFIKLEMELGKAYYAEHNLTAWCLVIWIGGFGADESDARNAWRSLMRVHTDFFNTDWHLEYLRKLDSN